MSAMQNRSGLGPVGLAVGFALIFAVQLWRGSSRSHFAVGAPAPSFSLPLLSGGKAGLDQYRGHRLVLLFWATWCGPCRQELPELDGLYARLQAVHSEVRFLAVSIDGGASEVGRFATALHLKLPIALDDGEVGGAYGVRAIPHTVVIDSHGAIEHEFAGAISPDELERFIR